MIVMATGVLLVFFVSVTVNLLAAWKGLSIKNTHDVFQSNIFSTHMHVTNWSKYSVSPDDVMFVSGRVLLFIFYICPCSCSRMTTVILSWTPQSCSNSSSKMSRLWSCSPTQTRRATSCSGQCVCLWFCLLTWVCVRTMWRTTTNVCNLLGFVAISLPFKLCEHVLLWLC